MTPSQISGNGGRPAVFFDRDGTLMHEVHYCRRPEDVRVIPGTVAALRKLREAGYLRIIITNQSGIGRGIITPEQYHAVQEELLRQLDGEMDATYFCPEVPEQATRRRKPGTGMIEEAVADWQIELARSWFVGDKLVDIECGRAAGTRTILVQTGYGAKVATVGAADFTCETVAQAIEVILSLQKPPDG